MMSSGPPLLPGAIPSVNSTIAGSSMTGVASRKPKSSRARSSFMYTSTLAAAGSGELWMTCTCAISASAFPVTKITIPKIAVKISLLL